MKQPLIAKTITAWQPLSKLPLTEEDAQEIVTNFMGFLSVLRRWQEQGTDPQERQHLEKASGCAGLSMP